MLKAHFTNGVFLLGLDADNIRLLKDGKPILVSLAEIGGTDDVMIMYGNTLTDIQIELEKVTGQKMPEPITTKAC